MIPHKPNKSHSKVISIQESLEIQIRQRKIQKVNLDKSNFIIIIIYILIILLLLFF